MNIQSCGASANVYAASIAGPVAAGAHKEILEALQPIADIPSVSYVSVEHLDGALLAEFGDRRALYGEEKSENDAPPSIVSFLTSKSTTTSVPILSDGAEIAVLTIHAQTGELSGGLGLVIFDVLVAAIFAGGIGVLIAIKNSTHNHTTRFTILLKQ